MRRQYVGALIGAVACGSPSFTPPTFSVSVSVTDPLGSIEVDVRPLGGGCPDVGTDYAMVWEGQAVRPQPAADQPPCAWPPLTVVTVGAGDGVVDIEDMSNALSVHISLPPEIASNTRVLGPLVGSGSDVVCNDQLDTIGWGGPDSDLVGGASQMTFTWDPMPSCLPGGEAPCPGPQTTQFTGSDGSDAISFDVSINGGNATFGTLTAVAPSAARGGELDCDATECSYDFINWRASGLTSWRPCAGSGL